jgi:DNA mismatch repair protein MutL
MSDVIKLLPDSVANQIAAGEVIQRPASVVKELLDNAIDAGSMRVSVVVKDAGRTLIQVIDNGNGMSDTDARMSFERHATSKIRNASDLFAIRTMGFRGEALASIAAVAEVTLITRKSENELGTEININGSVVESQQTVSCATGTNFSVKNLFYNIPARRKFLKSNSTELRHIITEFQRLALAFPNVELSLMHNQTELYQLPSGNLRQRIVNLFGKSINQHLIEVQNETSLLKISGFICKPEAAKKVSGDQYFFANNRFMRHPYFHKAVTKAYEKLIPTDEVPTYFIFFEVLPDKIDVNIHPTKTEIKFEEEQPVWHILHSVVKESLGKFVLAPNIDFENGGIVDIPVITKDTEIRMPGVTVDPFYNPFETQVRKTSQPAFQPSLHKSHVAGWEKLFEGVEKNEKQPAVEIDVRVDKMVSPIAKGSVCLNFKNKYILTPVKSGLLIIDQKRAHERILYETYFHAISGTHTVAQEWLYPVDIQLNPTEYEAVVEQLESINQAGFHMEAKEDNTIVVKGCPASVQGDMKNIVEMLLEDLLHGQADLKTDIREKLALSLAKASAVSYGKSLAETEMQYLIDQLFACSNPNYTHDGKPVLYIIPLEEMETKLK